MLKPDAQDDVSRLCRLVRMDPSAYIRFELPSIALLAPAKPIGSSLTADKPAVESIKMIESPFQGVSSTHDRAIAAPEGHIESPSLEEKRGEADRYSPAVRKPDPAVLAASIPIFAERRRLAESGMERDLAALASAHALTLIQPTVLPLAAAVAGAGVTTVLAGLGRALSILGDRILLVDASAPSPLDYFYRHQGQENGFLLSTRCESAFEGQVHVLRTDSDAPGAAQGWSTRIHRALAELRGRYDRILIAGRDALTPALSGQARANGVCLIVMTPELRSLLALPHILRMFSEHAAATGGQIKPSFLLNRFDESCEAHTELRTRLNAELGSQLLPFHIPESPVVAQALASGVTPLDLAPQSPFTEACFSLAEWYRTHFEETKPLTSQPEENQLVSN